MPLVLYHYNTIIIKCSALINMHKYTFIKNAFISLINKYDIITYENVGKPLFYIRHRDVGDYHRKRLFRSVEK